MLLETGLPQRGSDGVGDTARNKSPGVDEATLILPSSVGEPERCHFQLLAVQLRRLMARAGQISFPKKPSSSGFCYDFEARFQGTECCSTAFVTSESGGDCSEWVHNDEAKLASSDDIIL